MASESSDNAKGGLVGNVSLGIGDLSVSIGDHIGHFYQNEDEWRAVLIPFLTTGLAAGHKCVYMVSPEHGREEIMEELLAEGIGAESVIASDQLVLAEGRTKPEEMKDFLNSIIAEAAGRFPLTRWGGDMTWSLKTMPTSETLMEWETMCNVMDDIPAVFLCQYDLTQFLGNVILDAMKTHPLCIVGNVIHQNPFYIEPEIFLEGIRSR